MLLYAAADLIWASKIKATADAMGLPARPVRTLEMLEARLADTPDIAALLVDLDKGDDGLALIARLRDPAKGATQREARIRVLAWGPHVARELLQAARDAGANDIMTRGSFDAHMEETLLTLMGRAG
jgi:hypothetical protein